MSKRELSRSLSVELNHDSKRVKLEDLATGPESGSSVPATLEIDAAVPSQSKAKATKQGRQKKPKRPPPPEPGTHDHVLAHEIGVLLAKSASVSGVVTREKNSASEWDAPSGLELGQEFELVVSELSSTGDSISLLPSPYPPWAVITPFALPKERIIARVYRHSRLHSLADLVKVIEPNLSLRDDSRARCRYFGKCAGCQYQMLAYDTQLSLKRTVVENAYKYFSDIMPSLVPPVLPTIPSSLHYGYRTKITPHFDVPHAKGKKGFRRQGNANQGGGETSGNVEEVNIGFDEKGRRRVMDIEDCPIATDVINNALGQVRRNVKENIHTYKRGATVQLRDSLEILTVDGPSSTTQITPLGLASEDEAAQPDDGRQGTIDTKAAELPTIEVAVEPADAPQSAIVASNESSIPPARERHVCVTSPHATIRERVGDYIFEFPASAFFQNNSSVLVPLTTYVREAIMDATVGSGKDKPTHLVDAYCGSGLFAITLSPLFDTVIGVEISSSSIASATRNATLNDLPPSKCTFHTGTASAIFASVSEFPPSRTAVVIDPPRKGCDGLFLEQLVRMRPAVVVYVSCNVHTQARDVGWVLRKTAEDAQEPELDISVDKKVQRGKYKLQSLRGFDLFPQTSHVESVAVLVLDVEE